jgi:hypothetical protein
MKPFASRREFIAKSVKFGTVLTAGAVAATSVLNSMLPSQLSAQPTKIHPWPWPYTKLDAEAGRKLGHDSYYSGNGCSYGAFHAILEPLRAEIGEPFTTMPSEIMIYGHGGGAGWGTLCGALNGAAAAICLVTDKKTSDILISDLFGWYTQVYLPTDCSNEYGVKRAYGVNKYDQKLQQNKSGSTLCHVSGTNWSNLAGFKITSPERKERCARITGDTVAYAINILNNHFDQKFKPIYTEPKSITACNECHGKDGDEADTLSKMDCQQCHGDPH